MDIAIVGITGMVGKTMLRVLEEYGILINKLYLYASERSAGQIVKAFGKEHKVLELAQANIKKVDYALFAVEGDLAKEFVPMFLELGAVVIDNSSFFRMNEDVPLVIPEVNFKSIKKKQRLISNPNCSTIQAALALSPLHKKFGIDRAVFSTYQAVSGAGQAGVDDYLNDNNPPKKFPHRIKDNCIPHIDTFLENGYTKEEMKLINETKKILGDESIKLTATAVRVPVLNGHSESINVTLKKKVSLKQVVELLKKTEGIVVLDDVLSNSYPLASIANGKDEVFVGRIREDYSNPNTFNMWVVADNIRKGAASNAVQILKKLMEEKWKVK